jgi:hypothetical protein
MGQSYRFDIDAVSEASKELDELIGLVRGLLGRYQDSIRGYADWPGTVGSIAVQGRVKEQSEREFVKDTMMSIMAAVEGILGGTRSQIDLVRRTRDFNLEEIGRSHSSLEADGFSGPGTMSGSSGGRHGG